MKRLLEKLPGGDGGKILANAGWLYLDQGVRAAVVLTTFSLVARVLGPAEFGVLSYAVAFPGIFLPLAMLGLDYVVVRDFVRHPEERDRIFGSALALKTLAAAAACGLGLMCAPVAAGDEATRALLVTTSLSLLFQPLLTMDFYFQSQVAAKFSALARISACLIANAARAWLALRGAPVAWFAWVFTAEAAVYAATLLLAWRASGAAWINPLRAWNVAVARRLLAAAWPLFLADVAIAGYLKFDQILLSHLAGAEALGRYAAAYRLADAAEFFALALINSYFPRIVRLHAETPAEFHADVARFFRRMTWFAVAVAAVVSAASPLVAAVVLGPQFGAVWPVLAVLTWANVFVTQIAVRGKWFLTEGLQVHSLAFFVIGAAVHLSLLPLVAPRWGALGAAGSFCVAQMVMAVAAPALFARSRGAAVLALRSLLPGRT